MSLNQIPITYFVSASAVGPSLGLEPLKISTILILTDETPITPLDGDYIISKNVSTIVNKYGTNSETAKLAQSIFSQNPNILINNGYVIVANYKNDGSIIIPATSGSLLTSDITPNVDNFKTVEQGVLNITIDSQNQQLSGLDFTGIKDVQDIANYLQIELPKTTISIEDGKIKIASDTKGVNSIVSIAPFQNIPVLKPEVPATSGNLTTTNILNNIEAFKTVTSGTIPLIVDGTDTNISGLDFSTLEENSSIIDILNIIQSAITNENVTASLNTNQTGLIFTSKTFGADSAVVYNSSYTANADTNLGETSYLNLGEAVASRGTDTVPTVLATDIYTISYLNGPNATVTQGTNQQTVVTSGETLSQAISRLAGQIYFEGILTTRTLSDEEALEASNLVQSLGNRVFPLPAISTDALKPNALFSKTASNTNTKNLLYTFGITDEAKASNAKQFAAAYLSRGFAVNYSGSNTTLTMNLKDLVGIEADTNIDETILNQCKALGVDCFPSVEGLAKVVSNRQNGMNFDQVTNQIWFVNAIQRAVFNVLATTRTKISQTESGLSKIRNAIRNVCNQAVINGYLAPGTWNSPDTFGDYEDFHRNIREFGYYEYHPPVSEQNQAEREQRQAPLWQIAGKEAGAVHSANILIYIEP